ncbi:MAG: glutamine--fructose-6-phosphate transaminase (isomerizing) [Veillonellaceae bacterium]|nr:glutamine--fructose-6-phosphate transaminase (isomerizing) [Veillonellaceae bacterium]
MCGIVGYVGFQDAAEFLIEGLTKLEYRGYDSAGVACYTDDRIEIRKKVGGIANLTAYLQERPVHGHIGIGHTRWATHGRPSDVNAHPHGDEHNHYVVVHNGIIENFMELKRDLQAKGHVFVSETDTEVIAHLCEELDTGDFLETVRKVLATVEGSYALAFMNRDFPDTLICTKKDNPLIIGLGEGENFIASDIPAIIARTRDTYILNDGEIAVVTAAAVRVIDREGRPVDKKVHHVDWSAAAAEKGGYEHFMLKEIYEQPKAIRDTMAMHIRRDTQEVYFDELGWRPEDLQGIRKILITACGTAYHAGLVAKYYIEQIARIPVEVDIASEYRYREPLTDAATFCIVISQSGETSDTLAALKEAKRLGARSLAITNTVGSSIAREADAVVYTMAGPEISVASTKAYTTQVIALLLLAVYMGRINGKLSHAEEEAIVRDLLAVPEKCHQILEDVDDLKTFAKNYGFAEDVFFIGRSIDYAVAMEGSLKLKEISYIHAEAYAGGELKHGTLALVVSGTPIIALVTQDAVKEKMYSNIQEVSAREAIVIGIGFEDDPELDHFVRHAIRIPRTHRFVAPILAVLPLQLLAYYAAITRGTDVDKPRNLAKSVTVE